MKTVHGWAFPDADEQMAREMGEDGSYQRAHLDAALMHVTDHSIAVDAGAHAGTWSRVLSTHFDRVVALEPSPDTHEALVANMLAFGCRNVDVRNVALGSSPGAVSMRLTSQAAARHNTGARFVSDGGAIPRITLDSLVLPSLGFLKLDIEGSEAAALRGAKGTIARCRPIVLFENKWLWTKYFNESKNAVVDLLKKHQYRLLEQVGHDQIWGPRP